MENFSSAFTFTNKENVVHSTKAPPKTPKNSKSIVFTDNENVKFPIQKDNFKTPNNSKQIKNVITKRIPLGGKDKNASFQNNVARKTSGSLADTTNTHLSLSASKRRARRQRTPLAVKPLNRKLNVLRDEVHENKESVSAHKHLEFEDDDVEYIPPKSPDLEFVPLNYEPFTEEDLEAIRRSPDARFKAFSDFSSDNESFDSTEELPITFEDEAPSSSININKVSSPHFMEPTFVSNAKKVGKYRVYDDGLTSEDLQRLVDEEY